MANEKLDWLEAMEIADFLTNTENPDDDIDITENTLYEKWEIGFDTFHEIVSAVFDMLDFNVSPITDTPFIGISKGDEWLAKKDINGKFINGMITWMTEGLGLPKDVKGYKRTITLNGKPEFDISITHAKTDES